MQAFDFDPTSLTKANEFGLIPDNQQDALSIDPMMMLHQNTAPSAQDVNLQLQMQQYNQAAMMMNNIQGSPNMMMNAPYLSPPTENWQMINVQQQHQNSIRRSSVSVMEGGQRDDRTIRKRRASHRDVERRRREHINESIASLADLMGLDRESHNKGSILSAAVLFVKEQKEQVDSLKLQIQSFNALQ